MEGYFNGKEEAKENEVYRLVTKLGLSDHQIADFAEVPLRLVRKIRANIKSGNIPQSSN